MEPLALRIDGPSTYGLAPPSHLQLVEACNSIELDDLPLPVAGTGSQDNLLASDHAVSQPGIHSNNTQVTSPNVTKLTADRGGRSERGAQSPGSVPNYKPLPLRWPSQVFLLSCIGGLIGFFAYVYIVFPAPRFEELQDGSSASFPAPAPEMGSRGSAEPTSLVEHPERRWKSSARS